MCIAFNLFWDADQYNDEKQSENSPELTQEQFDQLKSTVKHIWTDAQMDDELKSSMGISGAPDIDSVTGTIYHFEYGDWESSGSFGALATCSVPLKAQSTGEYGFELVKPVSKEEAKAIIAKSDSARPTGERW